WFVYPSLEMGEEVPPTIDQINAIEPMLEISPLAIILQALQCLSLGIRDAVVANFKGFVGSTYYVIWHCMMGWHHAASLFIGFSANLAKAAVLSVTRMVYELVHAFWMRVLFLACT
ncbi:hypothetical protein FRB99_002460, partial [Tulasnella sp. 403]